MRPQSTEILIAIDGGGSNCRVLIADRTGSEIGRGTGGPANIATDPDTALRNIIETVNQVCFDTALTTDCLPRANAVLGLAGANITESVARFANRLPFARSYVTDDRETTMRGALDGADGCLAAIGTGSFFCRQIGGQTRSIGGWGFHVGDDGSGAQLGLDLLRRVVHCNDGLAHHSALTRAVLFEFNNKPEQIALFAQRAKPDAFAKFARRVVNAATMGDKQALALQSATVQTIQAALDAVGYTSQTQLCMIGSLGKALGGALDTRYQQNIIPPKGDALAGGLALATEKWVRL